MPRVRSKRGLLQLFAFSHSHRHPKIIKGMLYGYGSFSFQVPGVAYIGEPFLMWARMEGRPYYHFSLNAKCCDVTVLSSGDPDFESKASEHPYVVWRLVPKTIDNAMEIVLTTFGKTTSRTVQFYGPDILPAELPFTSRISPYGAWFSGLIALLGVLLRFVPERTTVSRKVYIPKPDDPFVKEVLETTTTVIAGRKPEAID